MKDRGGAEVGGTRRTAKIAVMVPALTGWGADKIAVAVANQLAHAGFDVQLVLFSSPDGSPYGEGDIDAAVKIVALRKRVFRTPMVARYIDSEKPDLIFTNVCATSAIPANKWLSRFRSEIVVVEHNTLTHLTRFQRFKRNILYRDAAAVVAISKRMEREFGEMMSLPAGKVRQIYNPVVSGAIMAKMKQPPAHPWLAAKTTPVFLGVGRLDRQKNFDLLIRAFALLRGMPGMEESRLIIAGEGDLRGALTSRVAELGISTGVDFPGFINNPYACYRTADVFVLSSDFEGLPTVLIEALACGCQAVSTDCPAGSAEILDYGKYGRLTPVGDAEALANAMREAYVNPLGRDLLIRRADNVSTDKIGAEYAALAREVLGIDSHII